MDANPSPIAVVTGTGSGIGRAIAQRLSGAGYRIALVGRRREALEQTQAQLADPGASWVLPADVTDAAAVDRLFGELVDETGRVDLLVNNAGTFGAAAPVAEYAPEAWDEVIAANLTGSFLCARRAFAQMAAQRPRGGRIVNNGSLSAHVPRPHAVAYTAAKHGVTGLTRALALEGRALDIACGQIDVGNAATEMTSGLGVDALQPDGSRIAEPMIDASAVADAVLMMVRLPLDANVLSLTVMATAMPFVGRG